MPNFKIIQDVADQARVKIYGDQNMPLKTDTSGNLAITVSQAIAVTTGSDTVSVTTGLVKLTSDTLNVTTGLVKLTSDTLNVTTGLVKLTSDTLNVTTGLVQITAPTAISVTTGTDTVSVTTGLVKLTSDTLNVTTGLVKLTSDTLNVTTGLVQITAPTAISVTTGTDTVSVTTGLVKLTSDTLNVTTGLVKLTSDTLNVTTGLVKITSGDTLTVAPGTTDVAVNANNIATTSWLASDYFTVLPFNVWTIGVYSNSTAGNNSALKLQVSPDGTHYIDDNPTESVLPATSLQAFVSGYHFKYARMYYRAVDSNSAVTLNIFFQGHN